MPKNVHILLPCTCIMIMMIALCNELLHDTPLPPHMYLLWGIVSSSSLVPFGCFFRKSMNSFGPMIIHVEQTERKKRMWS